MAGIELTTATAADRVSLMEDILDGLDSTQMATLAALIGLVKQTDTSDTTAGSLMQVGAFGLGANNTPQITDFTASLRPGFYTYLEASAIGAPGDGSSFVGFALVFRHGTTGVRIQAARKTTNGTNVHFWEGFRTAETGAITWFETFHHNNILGTVSEASGIPTGAIIERGSNANGDYIRFADGTQICTHLLSIAAPNTAEGSGFISAFAGTWTYPAAFATGTVASTTGTCTVNSNSWLSAASVNNTTAYFKAHRWVSTAVAETGKVQAIGRWF